MDPKIDRYLRTDEDRANLFNRLVTEIGRHIVAEIEPRKFLDHFLPRKKGGKSTREPLQDFLRDMKSFGNVLSEKEEQWYAPFVSSDPHRPPFCLNLLYLQVTIVSKYLPTLHIVNTSSKATDRRLKPDLMVYEKTENCFGSPDLDISRADFIIEMKREGDPFVYSNDRFGNSGASAQNLGQLTAYATGVLSTQYRTHTFSVLIIKDRARLIRWDRGGAVVTTSIPYLRASGLFDFFNCYNDADRQVRGHDSTVSPASEQDIRLAQKIPELQNATSLLTITIPDRQSKPVQYIISSPGLQLDVPVGRWTQASIALEARSGKRVLVKDSWRIVHDDIKPEGELYDRLHDKGVRNIPSILAHGDIGINDHHKSQTEKYIKELIRNGHRDTIKIKSDSSFTTFRHYQIVLGTVGRSLEAFKSTRELVCAIRAALEGEMSIFLW